MDWVFQKQLSVDSFHKIRYMHCAILAGIVEIVVF